MSKVYFFVCLQDGPRSDTGIYYCKKLGIEQIPLEKLKLIANHNSVETTAGYLQDKSTEVLEELFGIKIN